MVASRRRILQGVQWLLAAVLVGLAALEIARQWDAVRGVIASVELRWGRIAISGVIVLATYLLLIEAWRTTLRIWSARLGLVSAARIWFVSNLGKYVPGKVWQIAAMGAMAQRAHVPAAAAVGSSLVVNLVSIVAGFGVILLTGSREVAAAVASRGGTSERAVQWTIASLAVAGSMVLLLAPVLIPRVAAAVGRLAGRNFVLPRIPARAIWLAAASTALAWVMYGAAFAVFSSGVTDRAAGSLLPYVAVYTGSYLAGYLALAVPGGLGVREAVLVLAMPRFGLASPADAAVIAVTSRLWLTVLEVAPAMVFLARRQPGGSIVPPDA